MMQNVFMSTWLIGFRELKNLVNCASRGLNATELTSSSWFSGPPFLWEQELPEEETNQRELFPNDPEVKQAYVLKAGT